MFTNLGRAFSSLSFILVLLLVIGYSVHCYKPLSVEHKTNTIKNNRKNKNSAERPSSTRTPMAGKSNEEKITEVNKQGHQKRQYRSLFRPKFSETLATLINHSASI